MYQFFHIDFRPYPVVAALVLSWVSCFLFNLFTVRKVNSWCISPIIDRGPDALSSRLKYVHIVFSRGWALECTRPACTPTLTARRLPPVVLACTVDVN